MDKKYENVEGIEYKQVNEYRFALAKNGDELEGTVPKLLRKLAENRKAAKKDMANAKKDGNDFMYNVYNGKQLAFKVSMNSIYGFCGALVGFLPCKPVAECTTCIGREMIEHTKNCVEEWYPGSTVVYGDTDSVMVQFDTGDAIGKDAIEPSFKLGIEAADRISATFKRPIELEFEKVYFPYLLFSKKRYAGLMYTEPEKPDYIDAKGIQLVRRDNAPFVKEISQKCLNTLMYDQDPYEASKIATQAARDLLNNKVSIENLVVSKSLRRISYIRNKRLLDSTKKQVQANGFILQHEYSNGNLPHITVAIKRDERDPGTGPKSGDRVPYIFIDTGNPRDLQYLKAEDPEYAKANNIQPDLVYYLEHSLTSPLQSLFELFFEDPKTELFSEPLNEYMEKKNRMKCITELASGYKIDDFPVKIDKFQSYTRNRDMKFYGPAVRVEMNQKWHLGFVLHTWETYLCIAIVSEDHDIHDDFWSCSKAEENIIEDIEREISTIINIGNLCENGDQFGFQTVYYKFSVNQWRTVSKKKTKYSFDDTKPDKLSSSIVQRFLNN